MTRGKFSSIRYLTLFWMRASRSGVSLLFIAHCVLELLVLQIVVLVLNGLFFFSQGRPMCGADGLQFCDGRAFQHKSKFRELNFGLPQNGQADFKMPYYLLTA